jgi:hypothetical protein
MTTLTRARPVIVGEGKPGTSLLILSPNAGSMTPEIEAKLRKAFDGSMVVGLGQVFRFGKLEVTTKPKVCIYADNAQMGRTPATITAELSALKVILPR